MGSEKVKCPNCGKTNNIPAAGEGKPRCGNCHEPLPWIAAAGDGDFAEIVEKSSVPVLVDLWATWCGPCRMMAPAFEQAAKQLEPQMRLAKVDTEAEPNLGARLNIRSIPTLALFVGGREVARQAGAMGAADIVRWARSQRSG